VHEPLDAREDLDEAPKVTTFVTLPSTSSPSL